VGDAPRQVAARAAPGGDHGTVSAPSTNPGTRTRPQPTRARRPAGSPFFTSDIDGSPRWVVGAITGAQAALLSLLALVLPAVAVYVSTAADPSNAGASWLGAAGVGAALWLAAHGVPLAAGGAAVTFEPLGLTALALFACYASARRSGSPTWSAFGATVGAYAALALVVALATGDGPGDLARALLGGASVCAAGTALGLLARPDSPRWADLTRPVWTRCAHWLRAGAAAGLLAFAAVVLVAAVVAGTLVIAGRATVTDVIRGLSLDAIGGTVLAVGELAFVPNLVGWCVAWLAGPGFAVGEGTRFAPDEVTSGPLPAVPLLGALPSSSWDGSAALVAPAVVVLVGVVAGWSLHRRLRSSLWWHAPAAAASAAVTAGALAAVLVACSSGAVGPGRMAVVGASWWLVGGAVALEVLVGAVLVAVPADPHVRAAARRLVGSWREGTPD